MKRSWFIFALLSLTGRLAAASDWKQQVADELPLLGHRNWIVIADSAYPLQIAPGVQTINTNTSQAEVLSVVLAAVDRAPQVRANVFADAELPFVSETDAPGVGAYRTRLQAALSGRTAVALPHAQMIQQLADAGATFRVLLLKTTLTIPYTTVFLQLDCRYWSADAETRLRAAMKGHQ